MIEDTFTVDFDKQKGRDKTEIKTLVEDTFADIVKQGRVGTILVCIIDGLRNWTYFMDAPTQQIVGSTSFVLPISAFIKNHFDKSREEVRLGKTVEHPVSKPAILQSPQLHFELKFFKGQAV